MRKSLRWIIALLIVAILAALVHWLDVINQPRGCPPELLRHALMPDRILGRPAQVREVMRRLSGPGAAWTEVTTYTPAGEPLRMWLRNSLRGHVYVQTTTYSYSRRGWLMGSVTWTKRSPPGWTSFLYLPAKRRIEVEWSSKYRRRPPWLPAATRGATGSVLDRLKDYLHVPYVITMSQVIRLDRRNQYIDIVESEVRRIFRRTTFDYDRWGHVRREIWQWANSRMSVDYLKRDARGSILEKRVVVVGKPGRETNTTLSAYKYDTVGNWIERRDTQFRQDKKGHRSKFISITTRTITYRR